MKNGLIFLADGFEEVEAITVIDYLKRVNIDIKTVSITEEKMVRGAHDVRVETNLTIENVTDIENVDAVILPGGMPGAENLRKNKKVLEILREANESKKLIAAICAAPIVLEEAGVIKNRKLTVYPGFEEEIKTGTHQEKPVVVDGNLITAKGPFFAIDFSFEIVRYLLGEENVAELKEGLLFTP